jgi:hypothetical protein
MDVVKNDQLSVTVAADALRPNDNVETINVGGEIGWQNMLFVRGGYKSIGLDNSQEGLSLGAGVKYHSEGIGSLEVNYAFNKFGLFSNLNTIAVSIGF